MSIGQQIGLALIVIAFLGAKIFLIFSKPTGIGVVVLDLKMPEMDGLETLRRLAEIRPDLRIILTSGCAPAEHGVAADPRLVGFLPKPFVLETLLKMVAEGLARKPHS